MITYTATDAYGNAGTKRITVEALPEVGEPVLNVNGEVPTAAAYGSAVQLPAYTTAAERAGSCPR